MSKISELFGHPAVENTEIDWEKVVREQQCPYLGRTCLKNRKSTPEIAIELVLGQLDRDGRHGSTSCAGGVRA